MDTRPSLSLTAVSRASLRKRNAQGADVPDATVEPLWPPGVGPPESTTAAAATVKVEDRAGHGAHLALPYLFVMLLMGLGLKALLHTSLLRRYNVPFSVATLVAGVFVGVLYEFYTDCDVRMCSSENKLANSMRIWINIDPHLMLHIFLPALVFSDSFNLSIHMVRHRRRRRGARML
jgi:hypothetical protein